MVDVLVFGPHPDDIEICAGGLVLSQIAMGRTVGGIDLTAGESGTRGTREQRALEADEGSARLGLAFRECLGLPDGGITNDERSRDLVIDAIRRHRPGLVVAPAMFDHHPDHSRTGVLVKEARFLAGCSNIGPTAASPWRPGRVLFYPSREVAEPSLVVDISDHFDAKLHAIAAHGSQLHDPASDEPPTTIASAGFLEMITARAAYWGSLIGVARGEAYVVEGPLAVADPMPAVHDPGQSVFL
jgi:bacillithiol biosynthesis deacetylase BshB1